MKSVTPKLSRGVLVRSLTNPNRFTLYVAYQFGTFRRTLTLRCYAAGTATKFPGLVEITLDGSSATLCPRLTFNDANGKPMGYTDYYWTIPVQECAAAQAPGLISRAITDMALGR